MTPSPLKTIAICGAGLAGTLCAAVLINSLPKDINLILLDTPGSDEGDMFYGTVTSPIIYNFLLSVGITEPELLPQTNTAFSLGTRYLNWGQNKRSWTQSFYQSLPLFHGVEFHHYLTRQTIGNAKTVEIEPYIMSVQAARNGVFAHPPENQKSPLSNMEYGYHFLPKSWKEILSHKIEDTRIKKIDGEIETVQREGDHIHSLTLSDGTTLTADFFIDCTGLSSKITPSRIISERRIRAATSFKPREKMENICRLIKGTDYGWHSETDLQDGQHRLILFDPRSEETSLNTHGSTYSKPVEASIGYQKKAWLGNCLALGHSAAILEPLTPAPMMLLQRDIERLIELIPHTEDMTVEAQEYNRRFSVDYNHASLFQRGLFEDESQESPAYWKAAATEPIDPKLTNKILQFNSRGCSVQYDLEPFGKEDWIQQHFGMGRLPDRYDLLADRADKQQISKTLLQMRAANEAMAKKMPPHHIYMKKLLEYFRKKHV